MTHLVRAELLKLRTTRLVAWLALLLLGLEVLVISLDVSQDSVASLAEPRRQRDVVSIAAVAGLMALILGIVAAAGEWAHGTIAHTLLAAPWRPRVAGAKIVAVAIAGAGLAVLGGAFAWAYAMLLLSARSVPLHPDAGLRLLLACVLAAALTGAMGVGLGLLLRRQTAAVVVALIWLLVAEPLLAIAGVQKYAPGHVVAAVVEAGSQSSELLGFGAGLALALLYAAGFATLGTTALSRTDIT